MMILSNELNRYTEAIEILRKYNPLRSAYLYQICLWAEGECRLKPKPEDYGITEMEQ